MGDPWEPKEPPESPKEGQEESPEKLSKRLLGASSRVTEIPLQLTLDEIGQVLAGKEIAILQMRKMNQVLQEKFEEVLKENEKLKKQLEQFSDKPLKETEDGAV